MISCARAPIAIDWARIALREGHTVWMVDSLKRPIGKYLRGIQGYLQLPSPRLHPDDFCRRLQAEIDQRGIDMLIPVGEEIIYFAQAFSVMEVDLNKFMSPVSLLLKLHNKYTGLQMLRELGEVSVPHTVVVTSRSDIENDFSTILKPVYSRFGRHVIREVNAETISRLDVSALRPWVQQRKLSGKALCNYAIFEHGTIIAHQCYTPKYCLNEAAASYFDPIDCPLVEAFTKNFGKRYHYHGQVAFDFIEENGEVFVIECNPRATSGLHLINRQLGLNDAGRVSNRKDNVYPGRVGYAPALFFGIQAAKNRQLSKLWKDYRRAVDVLADTEYSLKPGATLMALSEMLSRSLWYRMPLTDAGTFDIEWDGDKDEQFWQGKANPHYSQGDR